MKNKQFKNEQIRMIKFIIITIMISVFCKIFIFSRAHVSGPSMMPTLNNNDSTLIEKISLLTHNFKRGQIIVFDSGNVNHDVYIKRIIGLEGDEIEFIDGSVYVNGNKLDEPYLKNGITTKGGTFLHENNKLKVVKDQVFVLGDNRTESNDSRYLGPINIKSIQGRVIFKVFPFNELKLFSCITKY